MLNPCDPCICPGASCEQCTFGYRPASENHMRMKNLLLTYMATKETFPGRESAERYMQYHPNWRDEIGDIPEAGDIEQSKNQFATLAKEVRELYTAFRNERFTEEESVELTKTYLGVVFQHEAYREEMARRRKTLSKSELAARLNRYKEAHPDKEDEKS